VVSSPILCQPPRSGGGEDGLAEAFEQGGDAGQAGVDGIYAGEDGVEFVGDAFLLGQRGQGNWECCKFGLIKRRLVYGMLCS